MYNSVIYGKNWFQLGNGIQIFDHAGELRPAGDIVNGQVWSEHWRLTTPDDYVGVAPYAVAAELYRKPTNPIALNPLTAVTLFLDGGFDWEDLNRAQEGDGYIAFTAGVQNYFIDNSRPRQLTARRPRVPRWLNLR